MLTRRFGLAKMVEGEISTPTLWKIGVDIKIEEDVFYFPEGRIERKVVFPPDIKQQEIKLMENVYLIPNISTMLQNTKKICGLHHSIEEKNRV